ncbi:hypothetical protein [Kutzneria buriramensis]|uniref:Uncharacterized protein n=1 Tax=Kutzneria buriramensis TaxID=1045776 RepID=A0A3E0HQ81_9PSEU|nr:hypothetical protein [Kutzneria buriramensis]REH48577.1 hypothetical protein BCF44_105436 [Kutzneria buriramensis]
MARRRPISTGTAVAGLVATLALGALAVRSPTVAPLLAAAAGWLGVETWLRHRLGTARFRHSLHDRLRRFRAGYAAFQRTRLAQQQGSATAQFVLSQLDDDDAPIPALLPFRPHADLREYAADELAASWKPLRKRTGTGLTVAAELLRANMVYPVLARVPAPKPRWAREIVGSVLACALAVASLAWLEQTWNIEPSLYHRTIPLALGLGLGCLLPLVEVALGTASGRRVRVTAIALTPLVFMMFWTIRKSWDVNWWQPAFGVREWLTVAAATAIALGLLAATSSTRGRNRLSPARIRQLSWLSAASVAAVGLGLLTPVLAGPSPAPAFPHVSACSLLSHEALARIAPNIDAGPANTFTEATVNGCEWFQSHGAAPVGFVAIDAYVGSGDIPQSIREFTLATHVIPGAVRALPGPCDQASEVVSQRGVEVVLRCGNLVLSVFSSASDAGLAERLAAEAARVATTG